MQYREYGRSGPKVSALGFGVMRLPALPGATGGKLNFPAGEAMLLRAMQAGVNFFDSHHLYLGGQSEQIIGRALRQWKGGRVYVQTKAHFYDEKPLDEFKRFVEQAVVKLGQPIDYLLFHSMTMDMFKRRGRAFFKLTDWAIKQGLAAQRGFSSHDLPENVKAFVDTGEFAACLLSFNWLDSRQTDTIAYAAGEGMGVSIMNPVGGGHLAPNIAQILKLLPGAKSAPEVGLRYVLATPGVATVLSGMSSLKMLEENVRVASRKVPMTAKQRQAMLARLARVAERSKAICTACGYCMPCPHKVDIPQNFLLLSRARLFGLLEHARHHFKRLSNMKDGSTAASACKRCGKCLPKCPNKIPIIDQLAETAELLG